MVARRSDEERVRDEFNQWAVAGRGEGMVDGHIDVTEQIIETMGLRRGDYVLDLGCGIGWATRLIAERCTDGVAVGVDLADEMIERARGVTPNPSNAFFFNASATALPFHDGYFDKAISIESLYYYPDIGAALSEVFRVVAPGAQVHFMVNLFLENEGSHHWKEHLAVPVSLLGESEYKELFEQAGFRSVATSRIYDRRSREYLLKPTSFDTLEHIEKALEAGSLVITGQKN